MLTGLSSNGQSVSVTASNSSDPLCCMLTVADAFTAPATCFDFGVGPCDDVPFVATDFSGSFFGFGGGGSGAGWALNNGTVQLTTTSDVDFVGFVVQLVIPGGLTSYNDVVLAADVISNVAGGVEYRIESWSPGFGFETGRTDLLPAVAAGATSVSGSVLGGGADLTSEYYQIVFAATGGLMPGSGPLNISVDNISFTGFQTRVSRIVAGNHLFIENQPASPNMDCVYEWYSTDTGALVGTTTTPMFDPGAAGSYEVIVNCTDGSYTPCGPLVIDEIIDCSNCNE